MNLTTALRITNGEVVAFVGGGGKTTAMFRLADEIVAAGGRVITSTTTRIFAAQIVYAPIHLPAQTLDRQQVTAALAQTGHVLVTGPVDASEGKATGVSAALLDELRGLPGLTALLLEADGSRMRPFKAPADHEPVIPEFATVVVPVVGVDALGAPLDDVRVHRPERVAALAGAALGDPITLELVARVMGHPEGGLKGVPAGARAVPLINKLDAPDALEAGRALAERLLENAAFDSVVLGQVRQASDPVREVRGRVAAVVLAAGRSTRMGTPKQVLPWSAGTTLVGQVIANLRAGGVSEIVVVTGAAREAVEAAVAQAGGGVRCVFNPDFATADMARSLQVGLRALPPGIAATLTALADEPEVGPDIIRAVVQRWRETLAPVTAPFYGERRGHPMLFDRQTWPEVLALPAEANPRALLGARRVERVAVATDAVLRDIDTPDDYARARRDAGSAV